MPREEATLNALRRTAVINRATQRFLKDSTQAYKIDPNPFGFTLDDKTRSQNRHPSL